MDFDFSNQTGNSKERRDQLKKETDLLAKELPFKFEKTSQLRILKAICTYIKKEKHFCQFKMSQNPYLNNQFISSLDENLDQIMPGFISCFTKTGELLYLSENITEFFGFNAMDILFAYDSILEIVCKQDVPVFTELFQNYDNYVLNRFSFFSSWFVSKIQKKHIFISEYKQFKVSGHYDLETELFVISCQPVLSINNRETLALCDTTCFRTTHKLNLQILDYSKNLSEFLGYAPNEFRDHKFNLYNLLSTDSIDIIVKRHKDLLVIKNTRGYVDCVKLTHKDLGYVDCLLNIYYDPKGFIVCVFQVLSKFDMDGYLTYMSKLENKEIKNEIIAADSPQSSLNTSAELSIKVESPFENEQWETTNYVQKREYIQAEEEQAEEPIRCKKQKCFYEQDIYNIQELLKEEVFKTNTNTNNYGNFEDQYFDFGYQLQNFDFLADSNSSCYNNINNNINNNFITNININNNNSNGYESFNDFHGFYEQNIPIY
ncbi:unnamed protein product [Brachionus calyciflorus]|uniref:Uncharacterized protein n=1 Tax=Brachionus calyciflorus TaxID=104777 RepID=A0A814CIP3_9BILA|nr:unnamed protein product [Brachionus calyciflorus]